MTDEGSGDLAGSSEATLTRPGSAGPPSPTSGRGDAPDAREELEEAIAALRAFALVDRETVVDEREPTEKTDTIRLHRLVREVAKRRREGEALEAARRALLEAMAEVYAENVWNSPRAWPRARRLDALALALVDGDTEPPRGTEEAASNVLGRLAGYRRTLAAYTHALPLYERALAICEKALGPEHPDTTPKLNNLALLLQAHGDLAAARPPIERALAIWENMLGPEHANTNRGRHNLARLLLTNGDAGGALPLAEAALAAHEKILGPDHPWTKNSAGATADALEALGRGGEAAVLRGKFGL